MNSDSYIDVFLWSRYEKWLAGEDLGHHPTDEQKTSAMTIAPAPSAEEFLINRTNNDREVRNVLLSCVKLLDTCMHYSWFSLAKLEIVISSCPWISPSSSFVCIV